MAAQAENVARWLAEARDGVPDSLGLALEACRGYLLTIAEEELEPLLRAKGGASDLVQETFLKAHRHFADFQGNAEQDLLAWLRRMLLNTLADFRRLYYETNKRRVAREVVLPKGELSCGRPGVLEENVSSPVADAIAREDSDALWTILELLPEDYRRVLVWRHVEKRPFEEIARSLNRSENAARKLWARALQRFQEEWEGRS
jgi:RNA polymerase sigma-70 factor (ECF subfamily)